MDNWITLIVTGRIWNLNPLKAHEEWFHWIVWVARNFQRPSRPTPSAMSRDIFNQIRLLRSLIQNVSRDEASATSLGNLLQCFCSYPLMLLWVGRNSRVFFSYRNIVPLLKRIFSQFVAEPFQDPRLPGWQQMNWCQSLVASTWIKINVAAHILNI